jgi:IS30 family transposase
MAKHLTFDDRTSIEVYLKENCSLSEISRRLNRHKSTITREIKLRSSCVKTGCFGKNHNDCIYRYSCDLKKICGELKCPRKKYSFCKFCELCNKNCEYFAIVRCDKLSASPYVCNGCDGRTKCTLTKTIYSAKTANKNYETILAESRQGIELSKDDLVTVDSIVSPLIKNGQSISHIHANNRDSIMVSVKTLYNYADAGLLCAKAIDMPRKVRYKPRKKIKMGYKVDKMCLHGRRYDDFKSFTNENPDIHIVEMDTVEGKKGGKVLLTIHFPDISFMLMFLRDSNDAKSVRESFEKIYNALGANDFKTYFPLILTDNGSEFSDPRSIENIMGGDKLAKIFYCLPYSSYQKPEIENNHGFIRKIVPKGVSMDNLTEKNIKDMMSHINSYSREKLNHQTPFDMFSQRYGFKLLDSLGVVKIPHNEIILKPRLIK